ncbi:hypothetical protein Lpp48_14229, partial [Lacticaseibacillus paracasei subsp. paracasei Lpp48]
EKVQDQLRHDFENKIQVIRDAAKKAVTLNQVVAKPAQADAQLEQLSKRIKQEVERIVVVSPAIGDKHKNVDDVTKPVTPANTEKIKPKDKKFIKVDQVLRRGDYKLEDSADVAELTAEFKRLLEAQLSDNTIVTLQVD